MMTPIRRQLSLVGSALLLMALVLVTMAFRSQQAGKMGPPLQRKAWNGWASVEKIFVLYNAPRHTSKRQNINILPVEIPGLTHGST